MPSQITVKTLQQMKQQGKKIAVLTAYDFTFARIAGEAGIHILLVGDSLGNVIQGRPNTLAVTMDEMIYHTRIVARGAGNALVIGDMPFLSYHASISEAVTNAGRFLKEAGAAAVKLEGGAAVSHVIKALVQLGIPVQAHIGLLPQSVHQMGGFKVQRDEDRLMADALEVQAAGAFSVVLEGIPADIAARITDALSIPTIGIGAGAACDGQVLVLHDCLGLNTGHVPKFVKHFATLKEAAEKGIKDYIEEVEKGIFPANEHTYS